MAFKLNFSIANHAKLVLFIQEGRTELKYLRIPISVKSVSAEHSAEEEHFCYQKQPHPHFTSIELLLGVIEMMRKPRWMLVMCIMVMFSWRWSYRSSHSLIVEVLSIQTDVLLLFEVAANLWIVLDFREIVRIANVWCATEIVVRRW